MSIVHHTQTTTRLPHLIPPYQIVFPGYMRALHSAATDMLVSRDGVGLNGFICTPAEYQALMGNPEEPAIHVPVVRPPELPDGANAVQISRFTYRETAYLHERNALAALKQTIIGFLDVPTIAGLENMGMGLAGLDCRAIVDFLRGRYGVATPEMFEDYLRGAITTYNPSNSIEEHVNKHLTVHRYANDMGQPLNDHRKVETLKQTLQACGLFPQAMRIYASNHPTFEDRTFTNFSDAMIRERNSTTTTTSTEGYSASMSTTDPRSDPALISAFMAYMATKERKPEPRTANLYCWRHGKCHHKSSDCNRRNEPGHQSKATLTNQMGGKKA